MESVDQFQVVIEVMANVLVIGFTLAVAWIMWMVLLKR